MLCSVCFDKPTQAVPACVDLDARRARANCKLASHPWFELERRGAVLRVGHRATNTSVSKVRSPSDPRTGHKVPKKTRPSWRPIVSRCWARHPRRAGKLAREPIADKLQRRESRKDFPISQSRTLQVFADQARVRRFALRGRAASACKRAWVCRGCGMRSSVTRSLWGRLPRQRVLHHAQSNSLTSKSFYTTCR
jgi:hypothetical protein